MDNFCLPTFMAQSSRRKHTVVWNSDYSIDDGFTDAERKEAIRHLSAELLSVWLYELNPSSPANKAKRKAICDKLKKWGKAK